MSELYEEQKGEDSMDSHGSHLSSFTSELSDTRRSGTNIRKQRQSNGCCGGAWHIWSGSGVSMHEMTLRLAISYL